MIKSEIEMEIVKELQELKPILKGLPADKGIVFLRKEAWRLADKYDTDGANVFNLLMTHFKDE